MAKQQIWLREDQVDLVGVCLGAIKGQMTLHAKTFTGTASVACDFTAAQIDDVLSLLTQKQQEQSA